MCKQFAGLTVICRGCRFSGKIAADESRTAPDQMMIDQAGIVNAISQHDYVCGECFDDAMAETVAVEQTEDWWNRFDNR
jgi:hypothetical protein